MLRIPHNAFVFVGDGTKALILRNEGDAQILNLKTERVFTDANPATHEQGRIVLAGHSRRSARRVPASPRLTGTNSRSTASP
jgi:protein required for attachment to host cells